MVKPKAMQVRPQEVLKSLFGFNGLKFPSRMPSDKILKTLHQLRTGSYPSPERLRTPELLELRRVCRLADIPESSLQGVTFPPPLKSLDDLPPSFYLPRGYERDIRAASRQKKIDENMAKMDERIQKWKDDKKKAKLAAKPEMPF